MPVFVSNLQEKMVLDEDLITVFVAAIEIVLGDAGYGDEAEVSLVFVDDSYIRDLNLQYRNIDRSTDVLSFPMLEGESFPHECGAEILLGDIVISLPTAQRQAEEYGHSLQREVSYLAVHGMLHLLGYDHQEEEDKRVMRQKEEEILGKFSIAG